MPKSEDERSIERWIQMKDWRLEKMKKLQIEIDDINKRIQEIENAKK